MLLRMKHSVSALVLMILVASIGVATAAPTTTSDSSIVTLKLLDGSKMHCALANAPTKDRADMASQKLVASGGISCKTKTETDTNKSLHCEQSQLFKTQDAIRLLNDACGAQSGAMTTST
ncbi:hypothetical protein BCV70DRAFT_53745 [Testicularia cyperi]|uniref:Uncharacterized protein n=1 Tax=Testicularia cyperi TaxID=1882483 RepID=A0A317XVU0_9BASI|nr:hypothetical protein BCV70DRAFT_53745 [Testicularia cyperi]